MPSDPHQDCPEYGRLLWQCRRGMLELDCILERYLEEDYCHAPKQTRALFVELLKVQDPELQAWLLNGDLPDDEDFANLARQIRRLD